MRKGEKVKAIADHLERNLPSVIQKLTEQSREALRLVSREGGMVQYGKLREYDDAMSFWWNERPPESPIGVLRLHGLLAVGKMPMKGRLYKVAVIPAELREKLGTLLSKE